MSKKRFKWVVEFSVDPTWVADGFDLTRDRAQTMLRADLNGAYSHEATARIISAPDPKRIATEQGFKSVRQMRRQR